MKLHTINEWLNISLSPCVVVACLWQVNVMSLFIWICVHYVWRMELKHPFRFRTKFILTKKTCHTQVKSYNKWSLALLLYLNGVSWSSSCNTTHMYIHFSKQKALFHRYDDRSRESYVKEHDDVEIKLSVKDLMYV